MKEYEIALTHPKKDPKYPVGINYRPDTEKPIHLWEGYKWCLDGALLSLDNAISPQWSSHFKEAGAEWFVELLRKLAAGENISIETIKSEYRKYNDADLPVYEK